MRFDIKKCVRVKGTDGPCMRIENSPSDGNITCTWWDDAEGLKSDVFAFDSLEYCDHEDQVAENAQKFCDLNKK